MTEAPAVRRQSLVQKLSAKSMGWDRAKLETETKKVPADGGKVFIGRFGGIVSGLKQTIDKETQEIQNGLKGNFRGISSLPEVGQLTSGVCYLPSGIQAMIEGEYAQAAEKDAKATVKFLLDVFAVPVTGGRSAYSFVADSIVDAAAADPLAELVKIEGETEMPKLLTGVEPAKK